jgi:hypothetical protein
MARSVRHLVRLVVGLSALLLTGLGGAAFASVPPPDPSLAPVSQTLSVPVTHASTGSGVAFWTVLLIAFAAITLGALFTEVVHAARRHRPASRTVAA